MKKLQTTYHIDVYECRVTIIVTDNVLAEAQKLYKDNGFEYKSSLELRGVVIYFDVEHYWICLDITYVNQINTINHELYHLMRAIAKPRAIFDEESRAWLMGYISQKLVKFLKAKNLSIDM